MGKKGGGKGGASSSDSDSGDRLDRIAIVNSDRCRPKKCRHECKRSCPVVKVGKLCIEVSPASKVAWISEDLCIGTSFHSYLWWFFLLFFCFVVFHLWHLLMSLFCWFVGLFAHLSISSC